MRPLSPVALHPLTPPLPLETADPGPSRTIPVGFAGMVGMAKRLKVAPGVKQRLVAFVRRHVVDHSRGDDAILGFAHHAQRMLREERQAQALPASAIAAR